MLIRCPTCRRELPNAPETYPHRPFCSARCKSVDLGRWLDEEYKISSPTLDHGISDEERLIH